MKEAADKFGVSKKTIARAVKKNNIKSRIPHIEAEFDSEQLTAIFEKPVAGFPCVHFVHYSVHITTSLSSLLKIILHLSHIL